MPDHGEVWSIPWEYEATEKQVKLSVEGVRFPYVLQKSVYLEESTLHQEYRVENQSDADFDYIWAAHPLFNTSEGMKLIVPKGMHSIVNAVHALRNNELHALRGVEQRVCGPNIVEVSIRLIYNTILLMQGRLFERHAFLKRIGKAHTLYAEYHLFFS